MINLPIPVPSSPVEAYWFLLGLTFARAFGKKLDWEIQQTDWFKNLSPFWKNLVKRTLDFLHHWWMGYGMWLYLVHPELKWFGAGIFIDDLPDVPRRVKGYFKRNQ